MASSLAQHIENIRGRSGVCPDGGESTAVAVERWIERNIGLISSTSVSLRRPMDIVSDMVLTSDLGVDITNMVVGGACDYNGVIALSTERFRRSIEDSERIKVLLAVASDSFARGRFLLEDDDAYRLLLQMTCSEKREFFWCCKHGVMLLVDRGNDIYIWCAHGGPIRRGRFEKWPQRLVDMEVSR